MNLDDIKIMLGGLRAKSIDFSKTFFENEFSVFSQFGDDGIIQYLINQAGISESFFIEFGVENYLESNTRFLLQNNNWSGLIIDGNRDNIEFIKKQNFYWKHDINAKQAFVTVENINDLIKEVPAEIGLLHIDIDGNDYWIWKAITVTQADIVIIEYNSVFGCQRAITVPYEPTFIRQKKHYSYLYAGVSLLALCDLADEKGYSFIGSNRAGNNAYFVRNEKIGKLKPVSVAEGYVQSKFRESRDRDGKLDFKRGEERLEVIKGLPIYNTRTNKIEVI
jgi:hypothetical protein